MRNLSWLTAILLLLAACGTGGGNAQEWDPCNGDSDCAGDLVCTGGVCKQPTSATSCLVDDQCPDGMKCVDKVCQVVRTSQCSGDDDCPEGQICTDSACVEDPARTPDCTQDEDCGEGEVCTDETCVPEDTEPECETDEDCAEGETCDGESQTCVGGSEGCTDDEDCESGICDNGAGECIDEPAACEDDPDCDDEDPCTEDSCKEGKCKNVHVAADGCCTQVEDCPVPEDPCIEVGCVDFLCTETPVENCCANAAECDDGNVMTTDDCVDNQCVNEGIPCTFDADCDDANACTIDKCKELKCQNLVSADPFCCATDADCDDGKAETLDLCEDNQCVFKTGGTCEHDADCADSNPCTSEKCTDGVCEVSPVIETQCKCANDGDCLGKGETCILVQTGPTTLGTYCANPEGPKLAGEGCTKNDECRSGFCASFDDGDICFGPCKTDMDCKGGTTCGEVNFNVTDTKVVTIPACITPPSECDGDGDCLDTEVCLPALHPDVPNTLITVCGPTDGAKTAGQFCAQDSDCESGVCLDLVEKNQKICWAACKVNDDCLPGLYCYPNLAYFLFDQNTPETADDHYFAIGTCAPFLGSWQSCWADSDCPGGEYCEAYKNQTMTDLEPHCITSTGSNPAGSPCSQDATCKSNWCQDVGIGSICIGLCNNSNECGGSSTCQLLDGFVINEKGDEVSVNLCLP